jgi:hypothetical protein
MKIDVGDQVQWTSMAGVRQGVVKSIHLSPASDNSIQPWMLLEYNITVDGSVKHRVLLCANHGNLVRMKVEKI